MAHYSYHVFFCTNRREDGRQCCAQSNASNMRDYLKRRAREEGLSGPGGVRVNIAGCLGRCVEGPTIVVYPDAVWYTYADEWDLEEILSEHLKAGRVVERLRLPESGTAV
ncbi:(2Fe-2S) ferredoxin domain-containing protein [Thermochromatium tepidum]|uniref:(2Fe-2S) ferredoxin domain-containing protein n=1 Tax=Thermochromatium tepidum ATCC 43061 TaxID=316276 RepID=A0A6I6DZ47_THETI|nr:(2Fe-2S) ferredoxin domain-containing protein [Thermochromatium tepidum]QGU32005.1 (2Fe-2S) ferredoxin domain-containing protein [Thermochromatium tepidum ATCC 43061]